MDWLTDWFNDWLKQELIGAILEKYATMFDSINGQIGDIASQVGQTPEAWNANIFSMIHRLSDTAIIPVAGMILTFVLCYELIQMIVDHNNMRNFEFMSLYKWIFKTFCAVWILTHTFDLVMAVFALAQQTVNLSADSISGSLAVSAGGALAELETLLNGMGVMELMGLWLEMNILSLCLMALTVCIFVIIFGRMIEIYLTVSVAPIPLATMANREWGQIGQGYLKSLFALAFQGFLIMVCVAIYAALVQSIPASGAPHKMLWGTLGYTTLLAFALFRTGSLSKSLFGAR